LRSRKVPVCDDVLLSAKAIAEIVSVRQDREETVGFRYRWNTGFETDRLTAPVSDPETLRLRYRSLD
jgi:hypothetical protein